MFPSRRLIQISTMLALIAASVIAVPHAGAVDATIMVNTTEFNGGTNGNCDLYEAMQAANSDSVVDDCDAGSGTGTDTIAFDIGGGGAQTITQTLFMSFTSPTIVDGRTQSGYAGTPLIRITRASAGAILAFQAGTTGSAVKGLQLDRSDLNASAAIAVYSDNFSVVGSYIYTDGTAVLGDGGTGISLDQSSNSTIGGPTAADRNLFGGETGVVITYGTYNTIQGNYFGVTSSGSTALTGLPGTGYAMYLCYDASAAECHHQRIRGNVITGYQDGIYLGPQSHDNLIAGNYIGVGADGSTNLGNSARGIYVYGSDDNVIGGTIAADRNVISGSVHNIEIYAPTIALVKYIPSGNQILGNYIGTAADGSGPTIPEGGAGSNNVGIYVFDGYQTQIGGAEAGSGNLIALNDTGIYIGGQDAASSVIHGNRIGTNASGTAALQQLYGIMLGNVPGIDIGNDVTPGGNLISGNMYGIYTIAATDLSIYGNRIGLKALGASGLPNTTGIRLVTSSATIAENWIGYNTQYGLYVDMGPTLTNISWHNCFTDNVSYGAYVPTPGTSVPLEHNWWGSPTGPTIWTNPGGTGDAVTNYVLYSPFDVKAPAACRRALTDFEGDGTADIGYFHPATGLWGILQSSHSFDYGSSRYFSWGATGDLVTPADYDGDAIWDPTVRRPPAGGQSAAYLMLLSTTNYDYGSTLTVPAGWPGLGDTPVPGDYNGDFISDPAIWRGNTGVWIIPLSPSFNTYAFYSWGIPGDKPIGADVDGDGQTDIGYWRPSTGVWGFLQSSLGYSFASPRFFSWGTSGDIPVMADYDGDGYDDPAVVIPPAGGQSRAYRILLSSLNYDLSDSVTIPAGWPGLGDTPVPADYDGDGQADAGIWRANTGVWIIPKSSTNNTEYMFAQWGASGDQVAK